ncbi:hypothetical protein GGX14DRAFT_563132 [Mycena pura]|uniref:Uncharacterized protein n=1 Tax=Mycena pura TaxID=153505 RepID=A0AAD6YFJ0_9AGAR|nr:hypothetical protein GGX14DRAFT_563132 [Mycena pura]
MRAVHLCHYHRANVLSAITAGEFWPSRCAVIPHHRRNGTGSAVSTFGGITLCMSVLSRTARAVPAANSECPIAYRCMLLPFEAAAPCPPLNDGRWAVARRSTSVQHLNGGGHGVVLGGGTHPASPTHIHSSASVRPSPPGPQRPEQSSALVLSQDADADADTEGQAGEGGSARYVAGYDYPATSGLEYAVSAVALHADAFGAPEMRVGQLPEPSGVRVGLIEES